MLIIKATRVSRDAEELEKIRKQIQAQTRQEVIVLPCGCELVHVSEELKEVMGQRFNSMGYCPSLLDLKEDC